MKIARVLLIMLVASLAFAWFAAPSEARGEPTTCVGVLGPVVVDDVVVPPGERCFLDGTHVLGDVVVSPGSELIADRASIDGNVEASDWGYVNAMQSSIGGDVACTTAFCLLEQTEVGGDVQSRLGAQIIANNSTIDGGADVQSGAAFNTDGTAIGEDVRCRDCDFIDVFRSSVGGSIRVRGDVYFGFGIFDTRVAGDVVISGASTRAPEEYRFFIQQNTISGQLLLSRNSGSIHVANNIVRGDLELSANDGFSRDADEPAIAVTGNDVGGDLQFLRNTGWSAISLNTIAGQLQCRGNDPAPVSAGNVFAEASGQCTA